MVGVKDIGGLEGVFILSVKRRFGVLGNLFGSGIVLKIGGVGFCGVGGVRVFWFGRSWGTRGGLEVAWVSCLIGWVKVRVVWLV